MADLLQPRLDLRLTLAHDLEQTSIVFDHRTEVGMFAAGRAGEAKQNLQTPSAQGLGLTQPVRGLQQLTPGC